MGKPPFAADGGFWELAGLDYLVDSAEGKTGQHLGQRYCE